MVDIEDRMFSIGESLSALSQNTSGLQDVMTGLNKSRFWTIISRSASGILPNFWAVQNKFRAITDAFQLYYEGHDAGNKQMIEATQAQMKLGEALRSLNPDLLDSKMKLEDFHDTAMTSVSEYAAHFQVAMDTVNAMQEDGTEVFMTETEKRSKAMEMAKKDQLEHLEYTQGLLEKAQKRNIQKKRNQMELDAADNPLQKWFIKQKQKLSAFTKMIGPVLKALGKFLLSALLWGTIALIGLLTLVTIVKQLWPYFKETRKIFVESLKLIWKGIFLIVTGVFTMISAALAGDWVRFFMEGLWPVLQGLGYIIGGIVGLAASALLATLEIFGNLILSPLRNSADSTKRTVFFVSSLVSAVLGILAIIAMFGSGTWLAVAAYTLGAAVAAAITKVVSPFASGGTVNSPLAIVGEKGPELVSLPKGSQVHSNADSKTMTGTTNITVQVQGRIGASDAEVKDMAAKVAREINLRMNRTGTTATRFT